MKSLLIVKFSNKHDLAMMMKHISWSIENECMESGYLTIEQQNDFKKTFDEFYADGLETVLLYRKSMLFYRLLIADAEDQTE